MSHHCRVIQRATSLPIAAFVFATGAAVSWPAFDAVARDWEIKLDNQAWACSARYSRYPLKVRDSGDPATSLCLSEGKNRKPISRGEAYQLCRQQFDATSLLVNWTSGGWRCRYYGR